MQKMALIRPDPVAGDPLQQCDLPGPDPGLGQVPIRVETCGGGVRRIS